jgi:NTE family protein
VITGCDAVVAVDTMGYPSEGIGRRPHIFRSIMGMFDIMQNTIINEKLKAAPPDIYIKPGLYGVDLLEFNKVRHILRQTEPTRDELKARLTVLLQHGGK